MSLFLGLAGGLALFLLGLELLTHGMQKLAGGGLRAALQKLTGNRISGALTGVLLTAAVNSSTVTTVLVVGFVSAGVLDLVRAVAVILGANLGSTVTAQLVAFDLGQVALGMAAAGLLLRSVGKGDRVRHGGELLLGLGLVFHGMALMGGAVAPLRENADFIALLEGIRRPWAGILAGMLFTAVVQSSAATIGIAITLAASGVLPIASGVGIVLGANVGTCGTALLAAVGRPLAARRAALVHVLFNVLGVLLWLPLLDQLAAIGGALAPAGDTARQLAHVHTVFNFINVLIFLPLSGALAALVVRLLPERGAGSGGWFLDPGLLAIPPLALAATHREISRLGNELRGALLALRQGAATDFAAAHRVGAERLPDLRRQAAAILGYVGRLRRQDLTAGENARFQRTAYAARALAEAVEQGLAELPGSLGALAEAGIAVSPAMRQHLLDLGTAVGATLAAAVRAAGELDPDAAAAALAGKERVKQRIERALSHLIERLDDADNRAEIMRLETAVIDDLRRLHDAARAMAKAVAETPNRP
jgi:phosphate:Na+ symporter